MILFITLIAMVVFSSVIYFFERDLPINPLVPDSIPFDSIPAAFWWCVITMTTVGYGDMVPQSVAGKLLATLTTFSGILVSVVGVLIRL